MGFQMPRFRSLSYCECQLSVRAFTLSKPQFPIFKDLFIVSFYVCECFNCMFVFAAYVYMEPEETRREPLALELQVVVRSHVGAGI